MKKNRQIHLFIENDLYDKIREGAEKEGIYFSQYIRNVLRKWYNKDVLIMERRDFEDIMDYIRKVREISREALGKD